MVMEHNGQKFRLPSIMEFSFVEYLAKEHGTYFETWQEEAAREHTHAAIVAAIDQREFARNFDPARQHFAGFLIEDRKSKNELKAQRYYTARYEYEGSLPHGPTRVTNDRLRAINKEAKAEMDEIEEWFQQRGLPIPEVS